MRGIDAMDLLVKSGWMDGELLWNLDGRIKLFWNLDIFRRSSQLFIDAYATARPVTIVQLDIYYFQVYSSASQYLEYLIITKNIFSTLIIIISISELYRDVWCWSDVQCTIQWLIRSMHRVQSLFSYMLMGHYIFNAMSRFNSI